MDASDKAEAIERAAADWKQACRELEEAAEKENEKRKVFQNLCRSADGFGHLSRRQKEVLMLVREFKTNKEIALALNISTRTAKFHVSNLLVRCGVQSRAQL